MAHLVASLRTQFPQSVATLTNPNRSHKSQKDSERDPQNPQAPSRKAMEPLQAQPKTHDSGEVLELRCDTLKFLDCS